MRTLKQAILNGNKRAIVQFTDAVRDNGGTFKEAYGRVNKILTDEGLKPLSLARFDEILREVDEGWV